MNVRIIITYKYEYIRDRYGFIRMHTERYLSTYLSIPSVTFRYGQILSEVGWQKLSFQGDTSVVVLFVLCLGV